MQPGSESSKSLSKFKKAYLIIDSEISQTISSHGLFSLRPFLNDLNNHDHLLDRIRQRRMIVVHLRQAVSVSGSNRQKAKREKETGMLVEIVITNIAETPDPQVNIRLFLEDGARQGKRIMLHRKMAEDLGLQKESWVTIVPEGVPEEFLLLRERDGEKTGSQNN